MKKLIIPMVAIFFLFSCKDDATLNPYKTNLFFASK
jgi:hypothetical protein